MNRLIESCSSLPSSCRRFDLMFSFNPNFESSVIEAASHICRTRFTNTFLQSNHVTGMSPVRHCTGDPYVTISQRELSRGLSGLRGYNSPGASSVSVALLLHRRTPAEGHYRRLSSPSRRRFSFPSRFCFSYSLSMDRQSAPEHVCNFSVQQFVLDA